MASQAFKPIPGYRIVRELGRGAMATVYLAVQESLGREVALKLLAPELAEDPIAAERFIREARTAARLEHRHIVGVHEVGKHGGQPYLSMEYMPGDSIAGGSLPPAQALQIVREIALALDHAHRQGVVHRDVKPDNILRRADGSCALADFGIARTADPGMKLTQDGMTVGTPHYMSPEQVQGQELDGRSDLYSLGVVLYQLLTGELPYRGTDGWNIGMQHISAPRPTLPPAVQRFQPLIDALMAEDPADRPHSGSEVARSVDETIAATTTPAVAASATAAPATQSYIPAAVRRSRRGLIVVAATVLASLVTGVWYLQPRTEQPATAPAKAVEAVMPVPLADTPRSIAVLPLVNLSGKPENEYFSDGLAESLLDMLAHVPDLTVIARTSSFAFKGKAMDVRKIGKSLDATHLLEGSVQQSGQRLRITVQLIRTEDGAHLWSQRYDRQLADVFEVQDEVAAEIVKAMELALPAAKDRHMRAGGTDNVQAYQEFLRGTALLPMRRVRDLQAAIDHFERAIELDPRYAMAYAMCANTLTMLAGNVGLSPAQVQRREQHLRRALQLDPNLGEAYIGRAALLRRSDPAAAERDFKRGLALAPSYTTGYLWYSGWLAGYVGRPADAVPVIERAIVIDPLDAGLRSNLGYLLLALARVEEAERIANKLVLDHPDFPAGHGLQAWVRRGRGDLVGELRAIEAGYCRRSAVARAQDRAMHSNRTSRTDREGPSLLASARRRRSLSELGRRGRYACRNLERRRDQGQRGIGTHGRSVSVGSRVRGSPRRQAQGSGRHLREQWPEWFKIDWNHQPRPRVRFHRGSPKRCSQLATTLRPSECWLGLEMVGKRPAGPGFGGGKAWTKAIAPRPDGAKPRPALPWQRPQMPGTTNGTGAGLGTDARRPAQAPLLRAGLRPDRCVGQSSICGRRKGRAALAAPAQRSRGCVPACLFWVCWMMSLPPPDRISGYHIVAEIGHGGWQPSTWPTQNSLHREVALKLLSPQLAADPDASERFLREGRIAAHLENRHIVGIHDVGIHDGQPYLAMEYLSGGSVAVQGALDPQMALTIVREIALALDHAHRHGVIHRDIKPENILIRADGSHALSDFGIARHHGHTHGHDPTGRHPRHAALHESGTTPGPAGGWSRRPLQPRRRALPADDRTTALPGHRRLGGRHAAHHRLAAGTARPPAPLPAPDQCADGQEAGEPAADRRRGGGHDRSHPGQPYSVLSDPAVGVADSAQALAAGTGGDGGHRVAGLGGLALLAGRSRVRSRATDNRRRGYSAGCSSRSCLAGRSPAQHRGPADDQHRRRPAPTNISRTAGRNRARHAGARSRPEGHRAHFSSFAFKGKSEDVREIGKALGVANLLEGSVQRSGEMVRITVQLVRASDGSHLWSQRYDRNIADVFKIQDEVATEVVKALQLALPAADQLHLVSQRTDNVAAYQEYLKGIGLLPRRQVVELREAAKHFEKAIEIDPGYARAYAAAAATYDLLSVYDENSPEEAKRRVQYTDRALELAPDLGEAYIERGRILQEANDFKGAEQAFKRGIALAPSYATGFQWYADMVLGAFGEPEKSLPLFERAIALDPLAPILKLEYANALSDQGRNGATRRQ